MKINFPKNPSIGQIFYSPNHSKVFRFDEVDDWIDITKTFLTLNYRKIRGEEK